MDALLHRCIVMLRYGALSCEKFNYFEKVKNPNPMALVARFEHFHKHELALKRKPFRLKYHEIATMKQK